MLAVEGKKYDTGTSMYLLNQVLGGTSIDWARGSLNIKYPYTIELRGYFGFVLPAKFIVGAAEEARAAAFAIARNAVQFA